MMGLHQKQTELWVEPVNLGKRVPEDHFLRKLNKMLDLGFVREEVSKFYGRNGNKPRGTSHGQATGSNLNIQQKTGVRSGKS